MRPWRPSCLCAFGERAFLHKLHAQEDQRAQKGCRLGACGSLGGKGGGRRFPTLHMGHIHYYIALLPWYNHKLTCPQVHAALAAIMWVDRMGLVAAGM